MNRTLKFLALALLATSVQTFADEKRYNIALRKTNPSLPRENVIVLTYKGTDSYLMMTDLIQFSNQNKLENDLRELLSIGVVGEMTGYQNYYTGIDEYKSMSFEQIISNRQKHIMNFTRFAKSYGEYTEHLVESFRYLNEQRNFAQEAIYGTDELNRLMADIPTSGATPQKIPSWQASRDRMAGLVSINAHAERTTTEKERLLCRNIANAVKSFDYRAYGSNFLSLMELSASNSRIGTTDSCLDDLHRRGFLTSTAIYGLVQDLFIITSESQGQHLATDIKLAINQIAIIASQSQSKWPAAVAGVLYLKSSMDMGFDIDPGATVELVASQQIDTLTKSLAQVQQIPASEASLEVASFVKALVGSH